MRILMYLNCFLYTKDPQKTSSAIMDRLCKFIYTRDTTNRIRTQAILSHIYHHALHDSYFEARDLMLMSHLQDNIQYSDIPTQVSHLLNGYSAIKTSHIFASHFGVYKIEGVIDVLVGLSIKLNLCS